MARPTKLTPELSVALVQVVRDGSTIPDAARLCKIDPRTVYTWLARGKRQKRGPFRQFLQDMREAQAILRIDLIREIIKIGKGGIKRDGTFPQWQALYKILDELGDGQFGESKQTLREVQRVQRETQAKLANLPSVPTNPAMPSSSTAIMRPDTRITTSAGSVVSADPQLNADGPARTPAGPGPTAE